MVYYRKYRPQSLSQLLGQEHVTLLLQKAFENGKLAHAYLFCGPRGVGKTSTARILAKMVNCESSDKQIPCNKCSTCVSITDGSNLDLIEIDAASNRGIDDIRELREKIKLAPTSAKKKVYIIDEVHMLTNEAFNALLKTLEEPPSHVLFILATTEAHKIPSTILSRVQKIDFKAANETDLLESLRKIVKEEKLEAEDEALQALAKKSEGSFRDCQKLLDQLASNGEKITLKSIENILKGGGFESAVSLLEKIAIKDTNSSIQLVLKEVESGTNIKEFTLMLLDLMRSVLLLQSGALETVKEEYSEDKLSNLTNLSKQFTNIQTVHVINFLQGSLEKLKTSSIPSLPLEVAVVESCQIGVREAENNVTQNVVPSVSVIANSLPVIPASEARPESNQNYDSGQLFMDSRRSLPRNPLRGGNDKSDVARMTTAENINTASLADDVVTVKDKWNYILETIKPFNYSLEALLKQVKVVSAEEGTVLLEVPYSFHQRILEAPKSRNLLESVLSDVLGKSVRVSCVLGKRPVRVEELANVELAADDEIIQVAAEIFNSDTGS